MTGSDPTPIQRLVELLRPYESAVTGTAAFVPAQLAYAVGTEEIAYAEMERSGVTPRHAVVLTATRVIWATLADDFDPMRETRMADPRSSVVLEVWPRRSLRQITLPADGPGDEAWTNFAFSGGDHPPGIRLELRFGGRDTPVRLPLATSTRRQGDDRLHALLPSLMLDLSAPTN